MFHSSADHLTHTHEFTLSRLLYVTGAHSLGCSQCFGAILGGPGLTSPSVPSKQVTTKAGRAQWPVSQGPLVVKTARHRHGHVRNVRPGTGNLPLGQGLVDDRLDVMSPWRMVDEHGRRSSPPGAAPHCVPFWIQRVASYPRSRTRPRAHTGGSTSACVKRPIDVFPAGV